LIENWADALERGDEALQEKIEAEMPFVISLKNLGFDDFAILAECAEGDAVAPGKSVGEEDLVKAVSEKEGPWITAFRQPIIEAIAKIPRVDRSLLQRWVRAVTQYRGGSEADKQSLLSAENARTLRDMCRLAIKEQAGVFNCFYG